MPFFNYRIWSRGPIRREESTSYAEYFDIGVHALAKVCPGNRFEVANEVIALRLGQAINLPIPPGIALHKDGQLCFSSLIFTAGHRLPPADTEGLVKADCRVACGIVVFDSWICNEDRHEKNLSFNEDTKEIFAFDHGMAMFGAEGVARLLNFNDSICIGRDQHAIALDITSLFAFDEWNERILAIPEYLIKDIVCDAIGSGIDIEQADECIRFLLERRKKLRPLFFDNQRNHDVFPSVQQLIQEITSRGDDWIEYQI